MRILLLLLLVALTNIVFAQDEDTKVNSIRGNEKYHQFELGDERYLLADHVNVRATPSSKGTVVTNLPIGTALKIIEVSDKKLRLNGFETNWYKISFKAKDNVTTGYVWGGLIAEGMIQSANSSRLLFLYGIASLSEEGDSDKGLIQIRACKNKSELSRVDLKTVGDYLHISHSFANYGNRGLAEIEDIIEFVEMEEMCGGVRAYNIVFWDGKDLVYVKTKRPFGDSPFYASDDLVFPDDKGGEKGKIIGDEQIGWYDEDKEANVLASHKRIEYVWTGKTLKQTKVLIDKEYDVEYDLKE
ncbi:MAG: Unknown protein [uncultured Aureispira sp.]|uniref:SH3b domain-containing protein n=1 Tax=uncultured Aureispira sp. TaxID=1331704 RepID=A0A6S6SAP2_9BACT|nr:MAG: Unknown protein [uncultured Aureispira sp.]